MKYGMRRAQSRLRYDVLSLDEADSNSTLGTILSAGTPPFQVN